MWKWISLTIGFIVGCGAASAFLVAPVWLIGGVLGGSFGLVTGLVSDARRFPRPAVYGVLGAALGAPLGCGAVWFAYSSRDSFSGGGLAGMTLGLPLVAVIGCAAGLWLGNLTERKWEKESTSDYS